jgi:DbpA RNA binding domain.
MVRYRLDVGSKHQITSEELKNVLIAESGVDKNNISNINIQGDYTLVELPDEMPQDIFLHLKSVEIKQRKLDIKRVKARNKNAVILIIDAVNSVRQNRTKAVPIRLLMGNPITLENALSCG